MMKPYVLLGRLRWWLPWTLGLAVLAVLLLWLAAPPVIALLVERDLRRAGWAEPTVGGVSLTLSGVLIDRVRLTPNDAVVAEEIRARVGMRGIEHLSIGRLRAEAEVTAEGQIELPGFAAPGGAGAPSDTVPVRGVRVAPSDIVPAQAVRVARADIRLVTAFGEVDVSLSDVSLDERPDALAMTGLYAIDHYTGRLQGTVRGELDADGVLRARLHVDGGWLGTGPGTGTAYAADVTGELIGQYEPLGASAFGLDLRSGAAAVADVPLGALSLQADWRDGGGEFRLATQAASAPSNGSVAQNESTTPTQGAAVVALGGRADLRDGAGALRLEGHVSLRASAAEGEVTFGAELASADNQWSSARGRMQFSARDLAVRGIVRQSSFSVAADIAGEPARTLAFTTRDVWNAELVLPAEWLPADMQALADQPVSLSMAPAGDDPLSLRVALAEQSVHLVGAFEASAGETQLLAVAELGASWAQEPAAILEMSRLTIEDLPWQSVVLGVEEFEGTAAYSATRWQVDGDGLVHAAGMLAAARFEGLTGHWSGTVTGSPQDITLAPSRCIEWTVASVDFGATRLENLTTPCIAPAEEQVLLTYDLAQGLVRFAASTTPQPLAGRLASAGYETLLEGTWPALQVSGEWREDVAERLTMRAAEGVLVLAAEELAFRGLTASVDLADGALVAAALNAAAVEHSATPALWAPVGLEISAASGEGGVSFDAILSDDLGALVLEASGRYAEQQARSRITLHPVALLSGATEIRDLSPLLARYVQDASGTIGFEGEVLWDADDDVRGNGNLSIGGFGATISGIAVSGVNTTIGFSALWPPVTFPDQVMEIERVSLGIPLERGTAVYDLDSHGRFAVRRLEFDFAGGRLYAEPFTFDSADMEDIELVLQAEAVELSRVLALSRIEGLAGDGVLSGRIPVRISDQGLQFDEGSMAAEAEGVLHYTPEDLPAFLQGDELRASMLREVLTNFHYEELSVTFAGETGEAGETGNQRLRLSARGANPEFLDGHPIELAFNFRGPLLEAMRSAVDLSGAVELEGTFDTQEGNNEETTQ